MAFKKLFHLSRIAVFFCFLFFWHAQGPAWATHDQGQGKSQEGQPNISIAPEPSGLVLFAVGGMIVAYRCRKKKKE